MVDRDDPQGLQGDGVLNTGTHIGGYELQWRIGEGGGAVVYRCVGPDGAPAAMKLGKRDAESVRLEREAEALESLAHPAFPHFIERVPGGFVMELVEGSHLGGARLPAPHAAGVVARVADALAYLHSCGIAHRDVKPENVLVDRAGNVRLIDLGGVADLSASGASLHTPGYRPPESEPTGADMDSFALGVLLDRLTVGDRPEELSLLIGQLTSADPSLRPPPSVVSDRLAPFATDPGPFLSSTRADDVQPRVDPGRPFGRYTLRRVLGRGGMGTVWEAHDTEAERDVALKIAHGHRSRLAREAKVIATLDHPNIVRLLDFGEHEGSLFLAMELVPGSHLGALLDRGPLPDDEAVRVALDIARGLGAAHARGLVHRDIKPANILLDDGRARLADFGLVQVEEASVELTHAGARLGTPAYMAPEQARGERVTAATDVYGLGAVLFHMIEGRPPHAATQVAEMMSVVGRGGAPVLSRGDAGLRRVVGKALADHPGDRYPDGDALAADLERVARGQRVAGPARIRPWLRRHRVPLLVVAAMVGASLAIFGGQYLASHQATSDQAEEARQRVSSLEVRAEALRVTSPERADAMLEEGLLTPEVRGSAAASEAWLRIAQRRTGDERLRALARSYLDAADREPVLVALGEAFEANGQPEAARRAGWVLAGIGGRSAAASKLVAAAEVGVRRTNSAEDGMQPVLSRLAAVTPIRGMPRVPFVGGMHVESEGVVRALAPGDGEFTLGPPLLEGVEPLSVRRGVFATRDPDGGAQHRLYGPEGPLGTIVHLPINDARSVDLDGDGADEFLVMPEYASPHIVRGQGTQATPLVPQLPSGERGGFAVGQLDGEGPLEIAIPTGIWTHFDLRVYRLDGSDEPPLIARESIGHATDVALLADAERDRIVVTQDGVYGSRHAFPAGDPIGLPLGIHVFALEDGRLALETSLPMGPCHSARSADIDGDGAYEVVVECGPELVLLRRSGGALHSAVLQGIGPVSAWDFDGDGDDELVAKVDDDWMVLGIGDGALPELPPPVSRDVQDPQIKRAVELHELGLSDEALLRLELLETMDDARRSLAALHRGLALADLHRFEEAQAAFTIASEDAGLRSRALELAADAAWQDGRAADAVHAAHALIAEEPTQAEAWAERLATWEAADQNVLEFSFQGEVPDGVDLISPTAAVTDAGISVVSTVTGGVLSVPVTSLGGPLRVELDATLHRAEWGGGMSVTIVPAPGSALEGVNLLSSILMPVGGAGVVTSEIKCISAASRHSLRRPQPRPDLGLTGTFISTRHSDGWVRCQHTGLGEPITTAAGFVPAGDVTIQVSASAMGPGVLTEATLRSLRIHGARLRVGEPVLRPGEEARNEVLTEILALDRDGDTDAADALFLAHRDDDGVLGNLLRLDPGRWVPVLRAALSPTEFVDAWAVGFFVATYQHHGDPSLDDRLITDLRGLESVDFAPESDARSLLVYRAAALRRGGQLGLARDHLARAWELMEEGAHLGLSREYALLEIADRRDDDAIDWIRQGLERSTLPQLLGDHLSRHPGLEPLHDHPEWGIVEAARMLEGE